MSIKSWWRKKQHPPMSVESVARVKLILANAAKGAKHGQEVHGDRELHADCETCLDIAQETIDIAGHDYEGVYKMAQGVGHQRIMECITAIIARRDRKEKTH